jgi:uncharacterized protein (DUF433 family)
MKILAQKTITLLVSLLLVLGSFFFAGIAYADNDDLDIEVTIFDDSAEVEFEMDDDKDEFTLDLTDEDDIIAEIAERYDLDEEDVEDSIKFEDDDSDDDDDMDDSDSDDSDEDDGDLHIKVEIRDGEALVKINYEDEGIHDRFVLEPTDKDEIIDEIIEKYDELEEDEIKDAIRFQPKKDRPAHGPRDGNGGEGSLQDTAAVRTLLMALFERLELPEEIRGLLVELLLRR